MDVEYLLIPQFSFAAYTHQAFLEEVKQQDTNK